MLHIKKLIFSLNKLSKQIKWNSINAPFPKFVIFVRGRSLQQLAPDAENPATPLPDGTILNKVFENSQRGFNCLVFYSNMKATAC
jgi:hypothetical protein